MKIGLFKGRHTLPKFLQRYIFGKNFDLSDYQGMRQQISKAIPPMTYKVELYCTGATMAIVEVIKYCKENDIGLTLLHYNPTEKNYTRQEVF